MNGTAAGNLTAMRVEDKVSGTGLIQQLGRGEGRIPVRPIKRGTADKFTRALDVLPSIDAGMVSLPDAPWLPDLLTELAQFRMASMTTRSTCFAMAQRGCC